MARYTLVGISNPAEGRAAECASWYDEKHLPDMVTIEGVISAQRFELLRGAPSKAFKQYMALYEIEAESDESARAIINRLNAANLVLSPSLDVPSVNLGVFKPVFPIQNRGVAE